MNIGKSQAHEIIDKELGRQGIVAPFTAATAGTLALREAGVKAHLFVALNTEDGSYPFIVVSGENGVHQRIDPLRPDLDSWVTIKKGQDEDGPFAVASIYTDGTQQDKNVRLFHDPLFAPDRKGTPIMCQGQSYGAHEQQEVMREDPNRLAAILLQDLHPAYTSLYAAA
jgi:hypothetical protein